MFPGIYSFICFARPSDGLFFCLQEVGTPGGHGWPKRVSCQFQQLKINFHSASMCNEGTPRFQIISITNIIYFLDVTAPRGQRIAQSPVAIYRDRKKHTFNPKLFANSTI